MNNIKITKKDSEAHKFEIYDGENLAGRAYLYIIKNDLHNEVYGYLEDVFLDEKYRGQGLGKELMQKVIEKAKEIGCYKIVATSRFEREGVHEFYKKLGFIEHGKSFRIDFKQ